LAGGMITDTGLLHHANAQALQRLAAMLEPAGLYVEDVLAVINSPIRRAGIRQEVLQALHQMREVSCNGWNILVTQTASREQGFAVIDLLNHLGSDVRVVGFGLNGQAMVFSECQQAVVEQAHIDLAGLMAELARDMQAAKSWGTSSMGRIVAPVAVSEITQRCEQIIRYHLQVGESSLKNT
jgi:hypothetical protein